MQILNIFHVLLAIAMIALILVQRGAGATAGAAFGSGASGTVFGSSGAGNFLTRATAVSAIGFFVISMTMAVIASNMSRVVPEDDLGVMAADSVVTEDVPAEPVLAVPSDADLPATDEAGGAATGGDVPVLPTVENKDKQATGGNEPDS